MTAINLNESNVQGLNDLAAGHDAFTSAAEIGADAATEAPATSPLCVGIIVGATLGAGC
ncbi:LxmA leader domain family RiPP [Glutamicibacter sp. PS]|uniref:LxmA leader domain family RiPP n=1 Tax=Glutamicibacter TaxID=1742989 RepID=UPI00284A6B8F|nr:LxmA leader domain family RiPP [Glutamicibacter sp. PS]MDR4533625.1 LxmA leader domain family RiPP [Glutamicibacter sp. PS]